MYTEWDSVENILRAVTRMLENRRGRVAEAPDSFRSALAVLDAELNRWPLP